MEQSDSAWQPQTGQQNAWHSDQEPFQWVHTEHRWTGWDSQQADRPTSHHAPPNDEQDQMQWNEASPRQWRTNRVATQVWNPYASQWEWNTSDHARGPLHQETPSTWNEMRWTNWSTQWWESSPRQGWSAQAQWPPSDNQGGSGSGTWNAAQEPQEEPTHEEHQWEYRQTNTSTSATGSSRPMPCSSSGRNAPPTLGGKRTSKKSFSRLARDFARNYAHKLAQKKQLAAAAAAAKAANMPSEGLTGPPVSQSDTHRGPQNGTPDSNATDEVKTEDSPDGTRISQLIADNAIPGREMEPQPKQSEGASSSAGNQHYDAGPQDTYPEPHRLLRKASSSSCSNSDSPGTPQTASFISCASTIGDKERAVNDRVQAAIAETPRSVGAQPRSKNVAKTGTGKTRRKTH